LPDNVDTEGIDATYTGGVLRIVIPKKQKYNVSPPQHQSQQDESPNERDYQQASRFPSPYSPFGRTPFFGDRDFWW